MTLAVELFGIVSECVILTYLLCKYFGYKHRDHMIVKSLLFCLLLIIYDFISGRLISSQFAVILGFISVTFIISCVLLKGIIPEKLAICSLAFILIAAINLPLLAISSAATKLYPNELLHGDSEVDVLILDTFLSKILYFIVIQVILLFRKKEKVRLKRKEWAIIIISFVISIIIASLVRILLITQSTQPIIFILITLCLTVLDIIILMFIIWISRSSNLKEENLQIRLRLERQEQETKLVNAKYEEISMLKHDLRKHISHIDKLIHDNKIAEAENYISHIREEEKTSLFHTIYSNQSIIDVLLNEKIQEAAHFDIDMSCRIVTTIPGDMQMDVCSILVNLIDNAIDYCKENKGTIIVVIQENRGFYRISVRNTIEHSILKYNSDLHTRKSNNEIHGWGIRSVRRVAQQHDGDIDIYEENNEFVVSVTLRKM